MDAVANRSAALQHQRTIAALRQEITRHQTARARANDNWSLGQRLTPGLRHDKWRFAIWFNASIGASQPTAMARPESHFGSFICQIHFDAVNKADAIFIASVQALAQDSPRSEYVPRQAKDSGQLFGKQRLRLIQAQANVGDAKRHEKRNQKIETRK
jgi:hypothetical protein